tara:strand:+ start:1090 stop:2409 length:1320 start_codon:yes stop_codon:yes gene_type:complete
MRTFFSQIMLNIDSIVFKSFLIGIFLLASSPAIASLFILFSIILGFKKNFKNLIKDKLNYLLLIVALIMIFKSMFTSFAETNQIENWDTALNWVGLGNWIPHFIVYLGAQIYVQSPLQRSIVAKTLILSTVPVIFSCFTQYILGWYGPYEFLNGLIIWFQKPLTDLHQPITGLFNNPNYIGAWIAMIWPFLLTYLSQKKKEGSKPKFLVVFALSISFITAIGLINSRGAWLGVIASIPLLFGQSVILWFIPLLIFIIFSILACTLPIFPENIKNVFCFLIPDNLLTNFNKFSISYESIPRLQIWNNALDLIINKPLFGWGAASFPVIYLSKYGIWKGHPHNLFLELSISYGLVTSLLLLTFIGILFFKTSTKVYYSQIKKSTFERAWWTSVIVFLIVHSFDIVYFDLRISIIFWILLAGLNGMANTKQNSKFLDNLQCK